MHRKYRFTCLAISMAAFACGNPPVEIFGEFSDLSIFRLNDSGYAVSKSYVTASRVPEPGEVLIESPLGKALGVIAGRAACDGPYDGPKATDPCAGPVPIIVFLLLDPGFRPSTPVVRTKVTFSIRGRPGWSKEVPLIITSYTLSAKSVEWSLDRGAQAAVTDVTLSPPDVNGEVGVAAFDPWIAAARPGPSTIRLTASAQDLAPGIYSSSVYVGSPPSLFGSAAFVLPVTLQVASP